MWAGSQGENPSLQIQVLVNVQLICKFNYISFESSNSNYIIMKTKKEKSSKGAGCRASTPCWIRYWICTNTVSNIWKLSCIDQDLKCFHKGIISINLNIYIYNENGYNEKEAIPTIGLRYCCIQICEYALYSWIFYIFQHGFL